MNCPLNRARVLDHTALAVLYVLSVTAPALAEPVATKPATEKWRPKAGVYASPGATFDDRCNENTEVAIELAKNTIGSEESECKVTKLTDTGPGAIRLDVACTEINRQTPEKEVILLKKIDEKTVFYRGTSKRKFRDAGGPILYCPEDVQRYYFEQQKKKND